MADQKLQRTLTLWDGMALAVGSIAGAGILYLPSLTYVIAGHDVLVVWLAGTLICLPLLFMFADMVRLIDDGSGIEGFIARGLGSHVASTVPLLFLSVVVLGIPAGALVAGSYLSSAIGGGRTVQLVGALLVLAIAIATNLFGAAIGARVQRGVTWGLLIVVVALCALTYPQVQHGYAAVLPTLSPPGPILSGIVVAFWAYAGFENLTFIAGEFRHPRRDFPLAMSIAFLAYGGLAVALTVVIAALIPYSRVSDFSGLLQLAERLTPTWLAAGIVVVFALTIMQLNAASWLWGMSRLIYTSAQKKRLPGWFAYLDRRGVPGRAVLVLGGVFVVMAGVAAAFPSVLVGIFTMASSVFLFLYLLCLLSYLRVTPSFGKRLLSGALFAFLLATLVSVGLKILYPLVVFLLALSASIAREAQRASHLRKEASCQEEEDEQGTSKIE